MSLDYTTLTDDQCEALITRLEDYVTLAAIRAVRDRDKIERRLLTWTDNEIVDIDDEDDGD